MLELRVDQETAKKFPLGEKVSLDIKGIGICTFEVEMQQLCAERRFLSPRKVNVLLKCVHNPVDQDYLSCASAQEGQ